MNKSPRIPHKNAACQPAAVFARWPLLSVKEQMLADEEPVSCSPTLKEPTQKACQSYVALSQYLGLAGGGLLSAATFAYGELSDSMPKLATDIWGLSGMLYSLMSGVNDELKMAIVDINEGKHFEPIATSSNMGRFPAPPKKGTEAEIVINGIWTALKGVLETVLSTYKGDDRLRIVISGLIRNGDDALRQLIPLLKQAFG